MCSVASKSLHSSNMRTAKATPIDEQPERRQTIALILVTASGYLPLARYLSWQITAFLALVLGLRLAAMRWPEAAPGRFALLALTAVGGLNCWHVYQGLPGRAGGAALFVTMLGLKLLELRARRDYRVVAMLLGFLVMVQFLFDQSGALTAYLAAVTLATIVLLVDLNGGFGAPGWRIPMRLSVRLGLEALPVATALFVLFPRLESPLWSLGPEREAAMIGMSDRLDLGSISELVVTGELAFRARFDGPVPPASRLYWRGLVLWFAGESGWTPGLYPQSHPGGEYLARAGDGLDYEVMLEPSGKRWMFTLDLPMEHPPNTVLSADFQLLADRPIGAPKRFRMRSALEYRTRDSPEPLRQLALQLPSNVTQRMRDLVAAWRGSGGSDWAVVQAALGFFHREPFGYTLLPPPLGANPTDSFLFETRSGYCEHYASSFALLMRIAGIPSRIVLGYLGGEVNGIGGHYMIRQSDAHAWVEVLIEGRGWVRIDPTAAVARERVDNRGASRLLGAAAPVRFQVGAESLLGSAIRKVRDMADSMDAAWQDWVVDYAAEHQRTLMNRLGLGAYGNSALGVLMIGVLSLVLGIMLIALVRSGPRVDPFEWSYGLFCRRLSRIGLGRLAWEGPLDYGRRVTSARPDLAAPVGWILSLYIRERYGRESTPDGKRRFTRMVKRFRPRPTRS